MKTSSDPAKAYAEATSFSAGNEYGYGQNQDQGYGSRKQATNGDETLLAPAQEQEKLKREVTHAFNDFDQEQDGDDAGFFVKRDLDQEALEGDDYRKFLLSVLEESGGSGGGEKAVREALKSQIEEAEKGDDGLRRKVRVIDQDLEDVDEEGDQEVEEKKKKEKKKDKGKEKKKEKSKEEKDEDFLMK